MANPKFSIMGLAPELQKALKHLCIEKETTLLVLVTEAVKDLLAKYRTAK